MRAPDQSLRAGSCTPWQLGGPDRCGGVLKMASPAPAQPAKLLSLRVMRLCQPRLPGIPRELGTPAAAMRDEVPAAEAFPAVGSHDFSGTASTASAGGTHGSGAAASAAAVDALSGSLSSAAALPEGFGSIYAGQLFTSYVSAENIYSGALGAVSLTAELQTEGSRRITLHDKRGGRDAADVKADVFDPGQTMDMVVEYALQERGEHILRVCVRYADPVPPHSLQTYKKFYRFSVVDPFAVSPRHVELSGGREALLEVQMRNIMPSVVTVESATLLAADCFKTEEAEVEAAATVDVSAGEAAGVKGCAGVDDEFAKLTLLKTNEVKQVVHRLRAAPGAESHAKSASELGRMQITWRSAFGERGVWKSPPLMRTIPRRPAVELALEGVPAKIALGSIFEARAVVWNRTAEPLPLRLEVHPSSLGAAIEVTGAGSRELGTVSARSAAAPLTVRFLARHAGLQALRGLLVVNTRTGEIVSDSSGGASVPRPTRRGGAATGEAPGADDHSIPSEALRTLAFVYVAEAGEEAG